MPQVDSPEYIATIAGLTEYTNALRLSYIEEEDWAVVANQLRTIEKDLAEKRREVEAQATAVAQAARDANPTGKKLVYESPQGDLVEETKRAYSYNSGGILAAVMEAGELTIGEAIRELRSFNALELKWKISFLENLGDRYGFELPRARHEIEDEDPDYLVGVVTTSKMTRG